ncbi:hypothetical protein [Sutcliffiella rhizosphaerae]|uniref:Uncharacterized protein n=1 Tax=Sutcliffiella rhizosphaerae TaxID=2880967 RepID=A0ABM8YS95_9BACI|nr:hypothetical protein [Sutcliffiella rhizosphaerae]CAG9622867.1 hypothetical protein BACCIP111883_03658 [Sutcliffiella rhizosphaerae]
MSEEQTTINDEQEVDPFTRLMFGRQPRSVSEVPVESPVEETTKKDKIGEDYAALLDQVDSIMVSVNKLKPMLKEFSPLLDYFKKK